MDLLWQAYEYFVCLSEAALVYYLFSNQLGIKNGRKVPCLAFVPLFASGVFAMNRLSWSWALVTAISLLLMSIYALLGFGGSVTRKLLWAAVPSVVFAFDDHFILSVLMIVSAQGADAIFPMTTLRAFALAAYVMANTLVMVFLSKKNMVAGSLPMFYRLLPLLVALLGVITIMAHEEQYDTLLQSSIVILPCAATNIVIVLLCGGTTLILYYSSTLYQKNLDAEKELQLRRLEAENIEQIKSMYESVRGWRHDMRGTLSALKALAESKDYDSMAGFIQELDSAVESTGITVSTGNPAIDAVISEKLLRANRSGVHVSPILAIPENIKVNAVDTCSVIMNLLDNALEAVENLPEAARQVDFSLQLVGAMLKIHVKNASSGCYRYEQGELTTTKADRAVHGFGLTRVRHIAEKHGGFVQIEPRETSFEVSVLLGLEES